ncbi:GT2 family glycosyltransferase [Neomicrococcus aestuarii]|uniref:GT2 family glycosyltransferase n=1 Tax=Neomicrococcus aestuarii TaxID=556325 RepID=A0A7W8WYQ9_9MICC|nr:GT2 family glycosyltransferase [Neomicrococcus aestuarii]
MPRLVRAFSRQDRDDFEVIFVIDGDIDGSAEYLRSSTVRDILPAGKVIEFPENQGRSAALNAGHREASGTILIRCDDDLEPNLNFINEHVKAHNGDVCGVVGLTTNVYPETPFARVYGEDADRNFIEAALKTDSSSTWRYWAANVSMPREIWNIVGPYDLNYRKYGWEDVDYGYRIHEAGFPILIAPTLLTIHHAGATTTRSRALRALHSGAAREIFLKRHGEHVLASGQSRSLWNSAVEIVGRVGTEKVIGGAASLTDRLLPLVPKKIGRKLVALLVEGAGLSGIRSPNRATSTF